MSVEYTVTAYEFGELSKDAQERVISSIRDGLWEFFDSGYLDDRIREFIIDYVGLEVDGKTTCPFGVHWSLGYSQGDGVSVYGEVYPHQVPAVPVPKGAWRIDVDRHTYAVHVIDEYWNLLDGSETKAFLHDMCEKAEREGYSIIEDETSEVCARDQAHDMGAAFFEDGEIISTRYRSGKKVVA